MTESTYPASTKAMRDLAAFLDLVQGHLGAAVVQIIPSDDQIVADHLRDAYSLIKRAQAAFREL